jgi:protein required for attachment to host cells
MKNFSSPYWVLVADSGRARIFSLQRKPAGFSEVQELLSDSRHETTTDLMTDASGRTADVKGGPSSHTLQPRSDAHNLAEQAFSSRLVKYLEQAAGKKLFERLVIIADPKTLGRLRRNMSKSLAAHISHEVNRDVVGLPPDELERRVHAELGWPD